MPVDYVSLEEARAASGLRMVVVGGVPSPWSEAAKGLLHVKGIPWKAVRLDQSDAAMAAWTGQLGGPVAIYEDEAPRSGWAEILILAERLAPDPAMLPGDAAERALAFGLAHEICGEEGLGWMRRLQAVDAGLRGEGGFPEPIARYLAGKYGYREGERARLDARVASLLRMLAARLHAQREAGSAYYVGDQLGAVDIYSATFMALLRPLPPEQCAIVEPMRAAFEWSDPSTAAALDPILLEHRDLVYAHHLELPLSL